MPVNYTLQSAYAFHRAKGKSASRAIADARADIERGQRVFYIPTNGRSPQDAYGYIWLEKPEAWGLRHVGNVAIENRFGVLARRHGMWDDSPRNGYYTDDDGLNGLMRGEVWQLPTRGGKMAFVPAYRDTDGEGVTFDFGSIQREDADRDYYAAHPQDYNAAMLSARIADSIAEREAERERDYQRAWEAGARYADTLEEIRNTRERVKELLTERRRVKGDGAAYPAICKAVRAQLAAYLDAISEARKARDTLKAGEYQNGHRYVDFNPHDKAMREAFNEGAGEEVL